MSLDRVEVWREIIFFNFHHFISVFVENFLEFFPFLRTRFHGTCTKYFRKIFFDFKTFHDCHSNLIKNTQVDITTNSISMKTSLIWTSSSEKISPRDGPPSGRFLKRRAVSDGPLRAENTCNSRKHFAVFDRFCPGLV